MAELSPVTNPAAVGFSIQADLGAGMQLVLQTHISRDEAMNGKLDGLLDRFHTAATRQRAKAEIAAMEKHVEAHEKAIAEGKDRVEKAEAQFRKDLATHELKIAVWERDGAQTETDSRAEWARSGKRGEWKASGGVAQRLESYRKQIDDAKKQIEKLGQERDKALAAENHARDVAEAEIAKTREKIKERQALISPAE